MEPSLHETATLLRELIAEQTEMVTVMEGLRNLTAPFHRRAKQLVIETRENREFKAQQHDELSRLRRKGVTGKFGGQQGIPAYRVEVLPLV